MSKQKYPHAASVSTSDGKPVRKGRENYSQVKTHAKQDRKRHEAYARQDKYDRLSTEQKLKELGPTGSKRQRARLEKLLASEKAPAVKVAPLTEAQKAVKTVKRSQAAAKHATAS
jgi:hypothetical protein